MRKIPLTNGGVTLVDDADYDWLNQYLWAANNSGYIYNDFYKTQLCDAPFSPIFRMSRLILGLESGDKRETDHKNHDPSDNRRCNIRICTRRQNNMNQRKRSNFNKASSFKGVFRSKRSKRWYSRIKLNGKYKHLGSFSKEKYAAQAYNLAAKKYFGDFAFLNKVT